MVAGAGTCGREILDQVPGVDTIVVDLQDVGCRVYTFLTTLRYVLEAAAAHRKSVWVLDRPNPAGRPVEGPLLQPGWESFVGAGPLPMRHGLTLGEAARWFVETLKLDVQCEVVAMQGWHPSAAPGYGWPLAGRSWVNPSPNAAGLSMARCYPGTVMLEGTTLSEGRGTTRPLELFGAPGIEPGRLLDEMRRLAPQWLRGCRLRQCWFEPTFHKHAGELCAGLQIHVDEEAYDHEALDQAALDIVLSVALFVASAAIAGFVVALTMPLPARLIATLVLQGLLVLLGLRVLLRRRAHGWADIGLGPVERRDAWRGLGAFGLCLAASAALTSVAYLVAPTAVAAHLQTLTTVTAALSEWVPTAATMAAMTRSAATTIQSPDRLVSSGGGGPSPSALKW